MSTTQSNKTAEYDGHCAFALSTGKTDVKGSKPNLIMDGKTYLFSNPIAKILLRIFPKRINKVNKAWENK